MEKNSLKHDAFVSSIPSLAIEIQPSLGPVATKCEEHGLIPTDVHEFVTSNSQTKPDVGTRKVLDAVSESIKRNPEAFDKFFSILGQQAPNCKTMSLDLIERHQALQIQAGSCTDQSTNDYKEKLAASLPRKPEDISMFTLPILREELLNLTNPIGFGHTLGIPQEILEEFEEDSQGDTEGQKMSLFSFIANKYMQFEITWEKIAEALDKDNGDLAIRIREKYYKKHTDRLSKKSLRVVRTATWKVRASWYSLGIELDIREDVLKEIKRTHKDEVNDCFTALLSHWLSLTSPFPTWSKLVEAVDSECINHHDVAIEIQKRLAEEDLLGPSDVVDCQLVTPVEASGPSSEEASTTSNAAYAIGLWDTPVQRSNTGHYSRVEDVVFSDYRNMCTVAKCEEQHRKEVQAELAETEDQLRASETREKQLQDDLSSQCTEITNLCETTETLQAEIEDLKSTLSKKEVELDKLTREHNSYEAQIAQQLDRICNLEKQEYFQGAVKSDHKEEIEQLTKQVETLKKDKEKTETELTLKHTEVEMCKKKIEKLTSDLKVHKDLNRRLSTANIEGRQQKKELCLEVSKLRQEVTELTRRCNIAEELVALDREDATLVFVVGVLVAFVALVVGLVAIYANFV